MPIKVDIKGKHKDLLAEALIYKTEPKVIVSALTEMPKRLVERIGYEITCSVKGKNKHIFNIRRKKRGLGITFTTHTSGHYPYGIIRGKQYDGEEYSPLRPITLRIRKIKKDKGKEIKHLDEKFILRETDKHILGGIKYKVINKNDGHSIVVYWTGKNKEIAQKHNQGFTAPGYFNRKKKVKVPPRKFIGLQDKLLDNLRVIYSKFVKSYGS